MPLPNRNLLFVLCLALPLTPLQAQNRCLPTDTIAACWNRYLPAAFVPEDRRALEASLNSIETGVDTSGANVASTVRNFLPLLRFSGLAGSGGDPSDEQVMTLDLNFLIPGVSDNGQLQAVINTDPQLHEPLAAALGNFMPNVEPVDLLGRPIGDLDDYALTFTYGLASQRFGRNLEQYRTRFDNLFRAAIQSGQEAADNAALNLQRLTAILQSSEWDAAVAGMAAAPDDVESLVFDRIADSGLRNRLMALIEEMAGEAAATEQRIREHATALGMRDLATLISNQPQLNVSFRRDVRAAYIGPDSTSLEISYEFGFVNMNAFNAQSRAVCDATDRANVPVNDAVRDCGLAVREYVGRPENRARLDNGDRLSISLAYSQLDDLAYILPGGGFRFTADGTHKVAASVAYGRLFRSYDGRSETRIDFEAKYEDASDDDTRNDRLVASLTMTRKLGQLSVPISLVYSNEPEFIIEGDAKLGVHIGVVFDTFADIE